MDEPKRIDRYPGIRSFEREEEGLFFGRDQEREELFALVKVSQLTLIFSKSGVGKTSVINAGLKPLLEADGFYPIPIRLQSTEITPVQIVEKALEGDVKKSKIKAFHPKGKLQMWHWLRAAKFPDGKIPVLIFDQFEEFFAHDAKAREEFVEQLADLVHEHLPRKVEEQFYNIPLEQRNDEVMAWYAPVPVKIIIAIRSDRMSDLDEMSVKIPSVLRDRYHLRPLAWEQARQAIVEPAKKTGDYISQPFEFAPETLEIIERNLKSKTADEVEPFQLQILCQEVERQVREKGEAELLVTPDYLGGEEGIAQILDNYYEKQIFALGTEEEQKIVRRLLEDELVADEKRVGMPVAKIKLSPDLQEKLLKTRLVRQSDTHLGKVYELSHDNLVQPVLNARAKREEVEKQRAVEVMRKAKQKAREKRMKVWISYGLFMTVATCVSIFSYLLADSERKKSQQLAERLEMQTDSLTEMAEDLTIAYSQLAEVSDSLSELTNMLKDKTVSLQQKQSQLKSTLDELALGNAEKFYKYGESLYYENAFNGAIIQYKKALKNIPPGNGDFTNKVKYKLALSHEGEGNYLKRQKEYRQAVLSYVEALNNLPPDKEGDRRRIRKSLENAQRQAD